MIVLLRFETLISLSLKIKTTKIKTTFKITLKFFKAGIATALFSCFALTNSAYAQFLNLPGTTDNLWYTTTNPVIGLNTANIVYGPVPGPVTNDFFASAYYDGSGSEQVYVYDINFGSGYAIASAHPIASTPDVIIGNWDGSSSTCYFCSTDPTPEQYIIATAFVSILLKRKNFTVCDICYKNE